jgi:hypothetical protein
MVVFQGESALNQRALVGAVGVVVVVPVVVVVVVVGVVAVVVVAVVVVAVVAVVVVGVVVVVVVVPVEVAAGAATTDVGRDVATAVPFLFVAVTTILNVRPESPARTVYAGDVAPETSEQSPPPELHEAHW